MPLKVARFWIGKEMVFFWSSSTEKVCLAKTFESLYKAIGTLFFAAPWFFMVTFTEKLLLPWLFMKRLSIERLLFWVLLTCMNEINDVTFVTSNLFFLVSFWKSEINICLLEVFVVSFFWLFIFNKTSSIVLFFASGVVFKSMFFNSFELILL